MTCEGGKENHKEYELKLKVDGTEIEIGPFVRNIASGTILGMISELKGVEDPKQVEIELKID